MPLLSVDQLKSALATLDTVRQSFDCSAPRLDAAGHTHDGVRPYGTHGAAFLGIDPVTGEVGCRLCAGLVAYHAPAKRTLARKGRRGVHVDRVSP
jgi:hypothetical protein